MTDERASGSSSASPVASPPTRRPPWSASSPRPATPSVSFPPSPRCASSAPPLSRPCPATRCTPASGTTSTRCRTSESARKPTSSSSPRPPPTCWRVPSSGRADDLLTATLLTARCPVLFAPAMHTEMWFHPATVDNVATLRRRGAIVLEPASGRLTGADSGAGRLPEAEEITTLAAAAAGPRRRAARTTWPASRCW